MTSKTLVIESQSGKAAATELIRKANSFKSTIHIEHKDRNANAKSLISFLSLGTYPGMEIKIITDGTDEKVALETISSMFAG